jgi:osmoprotectant transport system substrate-binding protein
VTAAGREQRRGAWQRAIGAVVLASLLATSGCRSPDTIVIGSKNFTEQLILGEILAQMIEHHTGLPVERRFYLAGTFICQQAMLEGHVDSYVEYTGTALTAVLKEPIPRLAGGGSTTRNAGEGTADVGLTKESAAVYQKVRREYRRKFNFHVLPPLGFSNSFALVMRSADARALGIHNISELARVAPRLRIGVGYEFQDRPDGWVGLQRVYGLHFAARPRVMDLGLLYRALQDHEVDVVVGSSTDGLIEAWHLAVLDDDRNYFPPYDAVPVVRAETLRLHPGVGAALARLAGQVSTADMRQMNYTVDGLHRDPASVAREFLRRKHLL